MANSKPPGEERSIILQYPGKRPYGTQTTVMVRTAASLGNTEGVSLLLDSGAILTIEPAAKAPWEGGDKFVLRLVGFPTATSAETVSRRLVQALLWTAISMRFPLRLEYARYEPSVVYNREHGMGSQTSVYATIGWSIERVLEELRETFCDLEELDHTIAMSMEIFAGAGLEVSQRAQFLAMVSALEPLSDERTLGPEVGSFVDSCLTRFDHDSSIPAAMRNSVRGRLERLRSESVRQGILRVIRENLTEMADAAAIVDEAYAVRSQIVHGGRPSDQDLDLAILGQKVEEVLRSLYSRRLKRPLYGDRA